MPRAEAYRFQLTGRFAEGAVRTQWVTSTRRSTPAVDAAIESKWQTLLARPGVHLFDGKVCRFEASRMIDGILTIDLSPTSYRIVAGTNFSNPDFTHQHGADVMANPLGVSTVLQTADDFLMLGRRNRTVAYYPERVHPFAGSMEVQDVVDPFENVRRELSEELSLQPPDIESILCLGLAEDSALVHPELIFVTRTLLTKAAINARLDTAEHSETWSIPATTKAIQQSIADLALTPISRAILDAWSVANK